MHVTPLSAGIVKRETELSDGRPLVYFDDADTTLSPDRAPDLRPADPRPPVSTMRQDVLTGEWIAIAAARQNRAFLPSADPLAPSTPDAPTEIPDNYDVAVFENRSPSFGSQLAAPGSGYPDLLDDRGLDRSLPGVGRCEVVCFSPDGQGSFAGLSTSRARTVIEAWADRTETLSALPGLQQVFPFENRGEAIGVTLHHPHGQVYGYPYVTPKTSAVLRSVEKYNGNLFADILDREASSERLIIGGEHWSAYVPFAARWPLEVHLMPHRHIPDLAATSGDERDELSVVYLRLLRAIDAIYDTPTPYISAWHQAPVIKGRDDIRLTLQLTSPRRAADKLKFLAGSESAMGAFIGDIPPEDSARRFREALAQADEQYGTLPAAASTITSPAQENNR